MKRLWNFMKKGVRKLRRLFPRRKLQQAAAFALSLGFCAYVLWYLLPTWLAAFIVAVAVFHEFAHYITAKIQRKMVKLPLFFIGPYLMVGATQVVEPRKNQTIALVGPAVGMVTALGLGAASAAFGFMPGVYAAGWLFVFQLWSGTFGSDGKAYREARKLDAMAEQDAVFPRVVSPLAV